MPADALASLRDLIAKTGKVVVHDSNPAMENADPDDSSSTTNDNPQLENGGEHDTAHATNVSFILMLLGVGIVALMAIMLGYKARKA